MGIVGTVEKTTYIKTPTVTSSSNTVRKKHLKYFQNNLTKLQFENSRAVKSGIQEYSSIKAKQKRDNPQGEINHDKQAWIL